MIKWVQRRETPERIAASTAALLALISAIIGGLAVTRSARRIGNNRRRGAVVSLVPGPIGLVVGGLVVATADVVLAPATD